MDDAPMARCHTGEIACRLSRLCSGEVIAWNKTSITHVPDLLIFQRGEKKKPIQAELRTSLISKTRRITRAERRMSSAFVRTGVDLCFRDRRADFLFSRKDRGDVHSDM
jgi:hypothetical protein